MAQQSMGDRGLGAAHPVQYSPSSPETKEPIDTAPSDYQPPGVDEEPDQEPDSWSERV